MPTESTYPKLDIPNIDLWAFLFERKDREYTDNKGNGISGIGGSIYVVVANEALQ